MPKVFLSPSNQTANTWCTKDTNEEKEAVYFADVLQKRLEARGVEVVRADDKKPFISTTAHTGRVESAKGCDAYIPLHTNGFNGTVRGCRLYVYKKNATDSALALRNIDLQQCILDKIADLPWEVQPKTYQDFERWGEMTNADAYGIPCMYSEAIFHDNAKDVAWYREHFFELVQAYADGICNFLGVKEEETKKTETTKETDNTSVLYRVQVGAFHNKKYAEDYLKKVQDAGFTGAFLVEVK